MVYGNGLAKFLLLLRIQSNIYWNLCNCAHQQSTTGTDPPAFCSRDSSVHLDSDPPRLLFTCSTYANRRLQPLCVIILLVYGSLACVPLLPTGNYTQFLFCNSSYSSASNALISINVIPLKSPYVLYNIWSRHEQVE